MINLIKIRNETLVFDKALSKKFGYCFKFKHYELCLDEVILIGLKLGICFDDDYEALVFITSGNKEFFIPYTVIGDDIKKKVNRKFKINIEQEFSSFEYEDYDKYFNKIIFPQNLNGNRIYKDLNLIGKFILLTKKVFLVKHYVSGILSKDAKRLFTMLPGLAFVCN